MAPRSLQFSEIAVPAGFGVNLIWAYSAPLNHCVAEPVSLFQGHLFLSIGQVV